MAVLVALVRDNEGNYHRPGEQVEILNRSIRSKEFDARMVIKVSFPSTQTKGAVFGEEITD